MHRSASLRHRSQLIARLGRLGAFDRVAEIGHANGLPDNFLARCDRSPTLPDVSQVSHQKSPLFGRFSLIFERSAALPDTVPDQVETPREGRQAPTSFRFVYSTLLENSKGDPMAKVMTKSQVIQAIADAHKQKLARKDVASVLETLATVGHKEMKKTGIFVLPGFAKFLVVKKPATKERPGINPFTKEAITIKAKPARKVLKARPVKAAKDSVA
jgi:DNA-binding protein HU-beta